MKRAFQVVWPYLWRYRKSLSLGMGALVMKDLLHVCLPLVIRAGVDTLKAGFNSRALLAFCGILVLLSACKGLFQYWMRVILISASRDIEYDLRNDFFQHLITLSSDFYGRTRTGDIMARATNDLNAVRMMLGPGVMYWMETVLTLILAVGVMLSTNWRLTLLVILPAPVVSFIVIIFGRLIHDRFETIQSMFSDISSRVQENLSAVRVIRAYVQEEAELRQFQRLNEDYIHENIRLARLSGVFMPLLQALFGVTFLIVLWAGGQQLLAGKLTLGSFVMFNTYMGMLIWPMIALGWVVNLMQRGSASLARIDDLMREVPAIAEPSGPVRIGPDVGGELQFRNVSVKRGSTYALHGINLTIRAGETLALVGHVGCGKTTLVQLIPRLLDPTEGAVLLDGVDLHRLSPQALRRQIGFVPQETFLFSATLGENIAWGVPGATEEQIRRVAAIAGLQPDIESFPKGYETVVGERGITLSGGQKQRAAIARAILRDPQILILDDALASVDTVTEERILNELASIMRGRTTILISHRVSTVRAADRIVVLSEGQIVEQGSHAELMATEGYYADLYQKQLLEEELETI